MEDSAAVRLVQTMRDSTKFVVVLTVLALALLLNFAINDFVAGGIQKAFPNMFMLLLGIHTVSTVVCLYKFSKRNVDASTIPS